jgi:hypothetical protein
MYYPNECHFIVNLAYEKVERLAYNLKMQDKKFMISTRMKFKLLMF